MSFESVPMSRQQIREYAYLIRKQLHMENTLYFPVAHFLEALPILLGDPDFCFWVDEDCNFSSGVHAEYIPEENGIRIRNSVYIGACNGNGRDRMTVMHEIGHVLFIKHSQIAFHRRFQPGQEFPCYKDPEWHAKCFAGEFLVPAHLVGNLSPAEVAQKCGVSLQAATYQLSKIAKKPSVGALDF